MKKLTYAVMCSLITISASCAATAGDKPQLTVKSDGIGSDGYISPDYAFCIADTKNYAASGADKSIGLSWSKGPEGTKSYAIIAVDPDVPTVFDDAGKEGKTLPASMPRKNFYHWVLLDIPATKTGIPAAADSSSLSMKGKSGIKTPYGVRGANDYASYFANDPERKGLYAGYDGPCPPWNDERVHHYHFRIFALDVASLKISGGNATGEAAMKAIKPHALAEGEAVGLYTLNPGLKQ